MVSLVIAFEKYSSSRSCKHVLLYNWTGAEYPVHIQRRLWNVQYADKLHAFGEKQECNDVIRNGSGFSHAICIRRVFVTCRNRYPCECQVGY